MNIKRTGLLLLTVAVFATTAVAQLKPSDQATIDLYKQALKSAENGSGTVEDAYDLSKSVEHLLTDYEEGTGYLLESVSDEEFSRLSKELEGMLINREEIIFARPDVDFWSSLARKNGDSADKAFFSALKKTYPNSVWPVYNEQQTDVTGCTRFGSLSLVKTYGIWKHFRAAFHNRYKSFVEAESEAVTEEIATSTCACGKLAGARKEITEFLRLYPKSPVTKRLKERLRKLKTGKSEIRESCLSG